MVQAAFGVALVAGELVVVVQRAGNHTLGAVGVEIRFLHHVPGGVHHNPRRAEPVRQEVINVAGGRFAPSNVASVKEIILSDDVAREVALGQHLAAQPIPA